MVQIHSPRPFISLESNTCNQLRAWHFRPFPSIPSKTTIFLPNLGREFETQTRFSRYFFAKRHVALDLVVEVGHILPGMTHPEFQYSWRCGRVVSQVRVAETPERMQAAFWLPELLEHRMQLAPQDARLVKWIAAP